ncbi:MAG: hypothetical protein L6Q98_17050 [Anaerolineae bacterium]|nr:hypothetical protein [Anaerolineae bacterium]NUQ05685.1 hypothetical protein [Anaerolineae bacterium]
MNFRRFLLTLTFAAVLLVASVALAASYSASGVIASGAQYDLYVVGLLAGENVTATLICDHDGVSRPLDPVLSVFFPGSDTSDTAFSDVYNDDGFGLDDDPNGVDCDAFDSSRAFFTAPVTGDYTFRADGFGSSTGPYTLDIVTGGGNPMASDGRLNPQQDAPVVLYCNGESVDVYAVDGQYQGSVANGGSATFGAAVFGPTADGGMQVSAGLPDGKTYLFVWDGCGVKGSYEAYSVTNGVPMLYDSGDY